jgi:hypothetical protein
LQKIIRTICSFSENPSDQNVDGLNTIGDKFGSLGYEIQTKRITSPNFELIESLDRQYSNGVFCFGLGSVTRNFISKNLDRLGNTKDVSFNLNLSNPDISSEDVDILFTLIGKYPAKTFNFTYLFGDAQSSPFYPSSQYEKEGYSIGLQPTDLADECETLKEWLDNMKSCWMEINEQCKDDEDFLGVDSSIAPLFSGSGSMINFIKKIYGKFDESVVSDIYTQITKFIKLENPKPVGLCGIMFPCLEDFELADEYEQGSFSIERNLFLSLHSGLGVDTYPVGIDESPEKILQILRLVQALSLKYGKSLSVRLVTDGKAKIGDRTDFQNEYLKDVTVRSL